MQSLEPKIETVADLNNDDWVMVQTEDDLKFYNELLGLDCDGYNLSDSYLFLKASDVSNGDITIAYHSYRPDLDETVTKCYPHHYSEQDVLVPCRQTRLPVANPKYQKLEPEYSSVAEQIAKKHEADCRACKIITGKSKQRKGLTQDIVALLFDRKMFGYTSSSGNYESESWFNGHSYYNDELVDTGAIYHYRTIESIWTRQGYQIENSQCWSEGFARCASHKETLRLPLTSILQQIVQFSTKDLDLIEVLEYKEGWRSSPALFRFKGKYYLHDRDENNEFIAELKAPCKTIAEAYESMKPDIVVKAEQKGLDVKRQGEYFFIPIDVKDRDITFESARFIIDNSQIDKPKVKYVPKLEQGSNHETQHLGKISYLNNLFGLPVAKGYVRHVNRDHQKLELGNQWHIIARNQVARAFSISNRRTMGD